MKPPPAPIVRQAIVANAVRLSRVLWVPLACLVLTACAVPATVESGGTDVNGRSRPGFSEAIRRAMPAVAGVYAFGGGGGPRASASATAPAAGSAERSPWSSPEEPANIGAGFFLDDAGHLVTAAHVVVDARRVLVKMADSRVLEAQVIDHDEQSDIALLKVPGLAAQAPALGVSAALRAGDWVLAIGEPFGLQRSVVAGIVAGRMRHFAEDSERAYIQSDLTLNPGNSGGPLLNHHGEIVGMNLRTVVGVSGTGGVSLSLPIEAVRQIALELQNGTSRMRPRLGAGFEDVSPAAAFDAGRSRATGAFINRVDDHGQARTLGLRNGDIVVGFNGRAIEDSGDLARWLLAWRTMAGTRIVVWRDRGYVQLSGG